LIRLTTFKENTSLTKPSINGSRRDKDNTLGSTHTSSEEDQDDRRGMEGRSINPIFQSVFPSMSARKTFKHEERSVTGKQTA
jgi:hypothetical protein